MAASYPDAQSPGSRVGPLTLIQAIAQGGEGIVYTARHDTLGDVVVKEFWPKQIVSRARDVSARAAQENWQLAYRDGVAQFIRLGQRLIDLPRHAGLMVALEVFEANNTAYLVTERVEGRTLDTALEAGAFSDPDDIRRLAERLGDAMAHLHGQGLFHRDLAPDNIIITAGFDWHPVLIDFNAAKDIVQKVSRSHDGIVKPGFTAIEQYAIDGKEPIGAWTDIYSASAVLYRCITGEAPADPAVRLLRPSQSPQLTDSHANQFDPALLRGVEAGLEPHPDNRPQTVAAWLAAMGLTSAEPDLEPAPPPTLKADAKAASTPGLPEPQLGRRKWLLGVAALLLAAPLAIYLLWAGEQAPGSANAANQATAAAAVASETAPTVSPAASPTADPVATAQPGPIASLASNTPRPDSGPVQATCRTEVYQETVMQNVPVQLSREESYTETVSRPIRATGPVRFDTRYWETLEERRDQCENGAWPTVPSWHANFACRPEETFVDGGAKCTCSSSSGTCQAVVLATCTSRVRRTRQVPYNSTEQRPVQVERTRQVCR